MVTYIGLLYRSKLFNSPEFQSHGLSGTFESSIHHFSCKDSRESERLTIDENRRKVESEVTSK